MCHFYYVMRVNILYVNFLLCDDTDESEYYNYLKWINIYTYIYKYFISFINQFLQIS